MVVIPSLPSQLRGLLYLMRIELMGDVIYMIMYSPQDRSHWELIIQD